VDSPSSKPVVWCRAPSRPQGTLDYNDGLDNTGLLTITGNTASLAVTGLLSNSGIIEVGAGASVTIDGTYQQKSLNGGPGPALQLQVQGTGSGQYGSSR